MADITNGLQNALLYFIADGKIRKPAKPGTGKRYPFQQFNPGALVFDLQIQLSAAALQSQALGPGENGICGISQPG